MKAQSRIKLALAVSVGAIMWCGCSMVGIKSPEAKGFAITVGTKRSFDSLEYGQLKVKGYVSDQVQGIEAAARGAVQGAIASQTGKP